MANSPTYPEEICAQLAEIYKTINKVNEVIEAHTASNYRTALHLLQVVLNTADYSAGLNAEQIDQFSKVLKDSTIITQGRVMASELGAAVTNCVTLAVGLNEKYKELK